MQDKIDALKTARASEDAGTIKTATESLSSALMKIGEAMAAASAKASASQETPPPSDGDGQGPETPPATNAEFKEKP